MIKCSFNVKKKGVGWKLGLFTTWTAMILFHSTIINDCTTIFVIVRYRTVKSYVDSFHRVLSLTVICFSACSHFQRVAREIERDA